MLDTHESLKDVAHASAIYAVSLPTWLQIATFDSIHCQPIVDTHKSALTRFKEATSGPSVRVPLPHHSKPTCLDCINLSI